MPVGIQRINAKRSQPNDRIVFIKPLKGPDEAIAQDFLERIAAQCSPVMRQHHLSVMSLEEYEPNREFVGRNFNAGEVVQLVLKSPSTGRWLPFNYVQMVMMHELAHCKQMNHSKAFWAVRNQYADQMRDLWSRGYAGDGLWGRGASLATGKFEANTVRPDEILPEHLCGGTYRSRRRKRKAKQQLSYQERKERRILKKFGANGVALGEDEDVKTELEKGKKPKGKPRVAKSKRGRELRAAAALARFDQQKKSEPEEEEKGKKEPDVDDDETASDSGSETASDSEGDDQKSSGGSSRTLLDANGQRLRDKKGHRLVKVCEDEDPDDGDAQNELRELASSAVAAVHIKKEESSSPPRMARLETRKKKEEEEEDPGHSYHDHHRNDDNDDGSSKQKKPSDGNSNGNNTKDIPRPAPAATSTTITSTPDDHDRNEEPRPRASDSGAPATGARDCPLCSFANEPAATACAVCAHVLRPDRVAGTWRCRRSPAYLNAGDSGVCGACGERKGGGSGTGTGTGTWA